MNAAVAGLVLTALVVLAVGLAVATRPARIEQALVALGDAVGLPITAGVRADLLRRVRAMRIGEAIGTSAGILLGLPFIAVLAPGTPPQAAALLSLGGLVVLRAAGRCAGGLLARPALLGTAGVAPGRRLVLGDYVGPIDRAVMWALAGTVAVAGPLPQLLAGAGVLPAAAGGVALATVLAVEITSRAVVAGPQATTDPELLVWDDALRSTLLRGLTTGASVVGLVAVLLAGPAVLEVLLSSGGRAVAAQLLPIAVLVLVLAAGVRAVLRDPPRRYLRRLWPTLLPPRTPLPPLPPGDPEVGR